MPQPTKAQSEATSTIQSVWFSGGIRRAYRIWGRLRGGGATLARTAFDAFHRQHHAQCGRDLDGITAAGCLLQLFSNVLPRGLFPIGSWQVMFDKPPYVRERAQCHNSWDDKRLRFGWRGKGGNPTQNATLRP
jgi:hypothetical protein